MRSGIFREIWVMEHDREALSFRKDKHAASMFSMEELRTELHSMALANCVGSEQPPQLLAACPILSPVVRRNLLVGIQCVCGPRPLSKALHWKVLSQPGDVHGR